MEEEILHVNLSINFDGTGVVKTLHSAEHQEYLLSTGRYHHLCDVVVPVPTAELISAVGVESIDSKIDVLYREIETLKAEKQKYLAIEHEGPA